MRFAIIPKNESSASVFRLTKLNELFLWQSLQNLLNWKTLGGAYSVIVEGSH